MTNVVKHSGAGNVAVDLDVDALRLLLLVHDDGKGVSVDRVGGRGLPSMRMRAEEICGKLSVEKASGTSVRLEIPLPVRYETRVREQGISLAAVPAPGSR